MRESRSLGSVRGAVSNDLPTANSTEKDPLRLREWKSIGILSVCGRLTVIRLRIASTGSGLRIICFRHPSSESSRLQLAFEFIEETPIGMFRDELLRAGLDQPCFMQSQRVK